MNYANFGTVSSGTMRNEDLIPDFASELEYHVQNNAAEWCSDNGRKLRDDYMQLIGEAREIEDYDSEEACEVLGSLFESLNHFAPPYAYFGAHPGDGSDYGFWLCDDFADLIADCGIKVSDTSEIPDDYEGEALHVNERGNCTLYACGPDGQRREVWSVV